MLPNVTDTASTLPVLRRWLARQLLTQLEETGVASELAQAIVDAEVAARASSLVAIAARSSTDDLVVTTQISGPCRHFLR